jgi:hypothetical protein
VILVSLLNKRQIIIVTLIISLLFISNTAVAKKEVYFNNENITNQVSIEIHHFTKKLDKKLATYSFF